MEAMSLSERDRIVITEALDRMEDVASHVILAGLDSFAGWLARELPGIFRKIRDRISEIWNWFRSNF
jgi:hypothetical protein